MTEGEDPLDFFSDILNKIPSPEHRAKAGALIEWIAETYPSLVPYIGWNQPMFTHHGTFILGMPGETPETIKETIDFACEMDPETIQVSLAAPYPGTYLYKQAQENGWL